MLGRLRMSVDEATNAYVALSDKIFSKDNKKAMWKHDIFKASTLEEEFKKVIADQIKKNKETTSESQSNQSQGNADGLERMMDSRVDSEACKV
jgi:hypothetical protein